MQVLVASHKATIRLLIGSLLGFDLRRYRDHLDQSPASLNILDFKDVAHARLSLFNDISHYSPTPSGTAAVASGTALGNLGEGVGRPLSAAARRTGSSTGSTSGAARR